MFGTSRKVEVQAAALYAGSLVAWTRGDHSGLPESAQGQRFPQVPEVHINTAAGLEGREAAALALPLPAVPLTAAAVRLRGASGTS